MIKNKIHYVEWNRGDSWQPALESFWDGRGEMKIATDEVAAKRLLREYRQRRKDIEFRLNTMERK